MYTQSNHIISYLIFNINKYTLFINSFPDRQKIATEVAQAEKDGTI